MDKIPEKETAPEQYRLVMLQFGDQPQNAGLYDDPAALAAWAKAYLSAHRQEDPALEKIWRFCLKKGIF